MNSQTTQSRQPVLVVLNAPLSTEIAVQTPLNFYLFQRDLECPFQTIILDRRRQSGASVIGINNYHTQQHAAGKRLLHILAPYFFEKDPQTKTPPNLRCSGAQATV